MSSDDTQAALARAYELVEAGHYDDARAILDPILAADPNDADVWWVYAHAVTSAEDGRMALENVVRINPNYPGASELLAQARELSPTRPKITSLPPPPGTIPEVGLADEDFLDELDEDTQDSTREHPAAVRPAGGRSRAPLLALLAVIIILIIAAVLVVPNLITPSAVATATAAGVIVAAPTDDDTALSTEDSSATTSEIQATEAAPPTRRPTGTPTAEGATAEAVSGDFAAVSVALAAFPLAEGGIAEAQSTLGNTLLVSVCSAPGREMRMLLPQVMNTLAQQSPSLDASIQAIGVSLVNCDTNTPMLSVASEVISAQNYAQGDLSDAEFAATWEPQ